MKTSQVIIKTGSDMDTALQALLEVQPDLVLAFGALSFFETPRLADALRRRFPQAVIAGCSTAGEIAVDRVYDDTCVVTAIHFASTSVAMESTVLNGMQDSFGAGARVAGMLAPEGLSAILLFGPGVGINGSALVAGLQSVLPGIPVSGGLAADGGRFRKTATLGRHGPANDQIAAVGLYGKELHLGYGSFAGWEPFGPIRRVTRCSDNVLHELDGKRALDIYQSYLGDYAKDLPGSGLLFPFAMFGPDRQGRGIFRTIIGINEEEGSLTLAGDIDASGYLRLMHASTEKLIEGAETAAHAATGAARNAGKGDALAILVSCVGRKLVMGDRIDEEIEAVVDVLGKHTMVAGFYSNGEIAVSDVQGECRLHNQTMTITWISEG